MGDGGRRETRLRNLATATSPIKSSPHGPAVDSNQTYSYYVNICLAINSSYSIVFSIAALAALLTSMVHLGNRVKVTEVAACNQMGRFF